MYEKFSKIFGELLQNTRNILGTLRNILDKFQLKEIKKNFRTLTEIARKY